MWGCWTVLVGSGRSLVVEMKLWVEYAGNFLACLATVSFYRIIVPRRISYLGYFLCCFESLFIVSEWKRSVDIVAYLLILPFVLSFSWALFLHETHSCTLMLNSKLIFIFCIAEEETVVTRNCDIGLESDRIAAWFSWCHFLVVSRLSAVPSTVLWWCGSRVPLLCHHSNGAKRSRE